MVPFSALMFQLWESKLLQSKAVEGFHTEEQAALQAAQQQQQQQQQVQPVQQVQQVTQQAQTQQVILPPQQQQGWFQTIIRHEYDKKSHEISECHDSHHKILHESCIAFNSYISVKYYIYSLRADVNI